MADEAIKILDYMCNVTDVQPESPELLFDLVNIYVNATETQ